MYKLALVAPCVLLLGVAPAWPQTGAAPTSGSVPKSSNQTDPEATQRAAIMQAITRAYRMEDAEGASDPMTVSEEPLLRFTNAVSGLKAGGFYVWTDRTGEPRVAAQIFLTREDRWMHEFQSLSTTPLQAAYNQAIVWSPTRAGIEWKPVPATGPPADSPVKRLVQMREIAKRFSASDEFEGKPTSDELRLLTKPLVRFGAEGKPVLDGALFTLAHGTDPELLILLSARQEGPNYAWHYALAPMTGYALRASLDQQPVWEAPFRHPPWDIQEPFIVVVPERDPNSRVK